MLMSLFSSFDALCAESFGQKVGLSWAPGAKNQQESPAGVVSELKAIDGGNKGREGSSSKLPSSHDVKKPQDHHQLQQKRRPRFAVELDGVHCFETIIPY